MNNRNCRATSELLFELPLPRHFTFDLSDCICAHLVWPTDWIALRSQLLVQGTLPLSARIIRTLIFFLCYFLCHFFTLGTFNSFSFCLQLGRSFAFLSGVCSLIGSHLHCLLQVGAHGFICLR